MTRLLNTIILLLLGGTICALGQRTKRDLTTYVKGPETVVQFGSDAIATRNFLYDAWVEKKRA